MEDHLILLHRPLVKDLGGDVFRRDVDALGPGFVQHVGEQPHLELETEDVHPGDVLFAALEDDLLDKEPRHREVDRPDGHQPPGFLAVEMLELLQRLGPVGFEDEIEKRRLFGRQLPALLLFAEAGVDPHKMLALVFAEVEDLKGPVVLAVAFKLALDPDHPLPGGVDGELAEIRADPSAAQLLRHRRRRAGAAEEVGHEVAGVG